MKIFYSIVTFSAVLLFSLLGQIELKAQTNPAAQSLPYIQNFNSLTSISTTYPVGFQGWNLSTGGSSTSFRTITPPPSSDLSLIASATAASTTGGIQNYNGKIGILSSGSSDATLCLAISTTGFFTVTMNFDVMTIRNPYDASTNTHINQVDLQYRIGTSGVFASVSGIASGIYQNNTTTQISAITIPQNSLTKVFTLPAACNNQPIVQLRWVQRDVSGIGSRPSFAIDNLSICSVSVTPTISISGPSAFCSSGNATYTSTITNGGSTPNYQWKKNGSNISTNTPTPTLTGLIVGDQISCTLTSNQSCVTANVIASNVITIGVVNSAPTISNAVISNVSCPNAKNGSINITVTGGTAPYTILWDTINTINGALFGVTAGIKTASNPLFGLGSTSGFILDGVEAKELFLTRGITYSFSVLTPSHPFHISTDNIGGNATFLVTNGQSGAPTQNGTVTFKPSSVTPNLLYYACQFHQFMGYKVNITNGFATEDVTNLKAGKYTVIVADANGCSTSAQYTVIELPSPVTLNASITNAICSSSTGAIDLTVSGGVAPYTISWDTINTNGPTFGIIAGVKTASNPYFGLGSTSCFYIDGVEAKTISLIRNINYTFNILSPSHPWHISTDFIGGNTSNIVTNAQVGAPSENGTVFFTPNAAHPNLLRYVCANHQYMGNNINIVNGMLSEDLSNLHAGTYTVFVKDMNGCSATAQYIVNSTTSTIVLSATVTNTNCNSATGAIDLSAASGLAPYNFVWDTFNTLNGSVFGVMIGDKTPNGPYYQLGNPSSFYIDGVESKELTLTRNIPYTFNVFSSGHPWHISTENIGGNSNNIVVSGQTGAPNDNGTVFFTPNFTHPSLLHYICANHAYMGYDIHIINGTLTEDLNNLGAGVYSVIATDQNGCTAMANYIIATNGTCNVTLNLKAFLQGMYTGSGTMQPTLFSLGISSDQTASDSITVELHDVINPTVIVASSTVVLHTDGIAQIQYPSSVIGSSYYIVIHNRNAIETWSKLPVLFDNSIMSFDFTN